MDPAMESEKAALSEEPKSTWCIGTETQDVHHITMLRPRSRTCNGQCPWLQANHDRTVTLYYDHEVPGIAMPESFTFAVWKRVDVWTNDLRHGQPGFGSLCHVRMKGTEQTPRDAWNVVSRQCTGALVMQQRELLRHVRSASSALSLQGAAHVASDMLGRPVTEPEVCKLDLASLLAHAHPSLLDPAIGCGAVAASPSEREIEQWRKQP
jgi:hypothetical protein